MDLAQPNGHSTARSMNVRVRDQLFAREYNRYLVERLISDADWRLCLDDTYCGGLDRDRYSDTGMVFYSYHSDVPLQQIQQDPVRTWFNTAAELILHTALGHNRAVEIDRVMWNYYSRSSTGVTHQDYHEPGRTSMVYNLTNTDGGTWIEDQYFQGDQGRALIFPSELNHRGQGPEQQPYRMVLNVIFSQPDK